MGAAVSVVASVVVPVATILISQLIQAFTQRPAQPNPVMEAIRVEAQQASAAAPAPPSPFGSATETALAISSRPWTGTPAVPLQTAPLLTSAFNRVQMAWKKKMRPTTWPTWEEYEQAIAMTEDPEGRFFHFGIAGSVKSGKSSLINSLRGMDPDPKNPRAAKVGSSECTVRITRYEDPRPDHPFAWYDIPGSGTAAVPAESYFNSQGLFAMDCILVVIRDSFTQADAQLIQHCNELCIPTYLVRSKSDRDIQDIMEDNSVDHGTARSLYKHDSLENALKAIRDFTLPRQRCYLVNKIDVKNLILGHPLSGNAIHEGELITDILTECRQRRLSSKSRGDESLATSAVSMIEDTNHTREGRVLSSRVSLGRGSSG